MSITYDINANPQGFEAAMNRAANAAQQGSQRIAAQFSSMKGMLDKVMGSFGLMTGIIGGVFAVDKLRDFVDETYRLNDAAEDLAAKLGAGATQAGLLTTRLRLADLESETYTSGLLALQKQLAKNEDGLRAMGLTTRDASGALLDQLQLMDNAIGVLSQYKAGTDRLQAAMVLFGKGAGEAEQLLKLLNVSQSETRDVAEALNLVLSEQSQKASSEYEQALHRAGLGLTGLRKTIGDQFMPTVTDMLNTFNFAIPAAVTVVRGALGGFVAVFEGLTAVVRTALDVVSAMVFFFAESIRGIWMGMARAMMGDFSGAADELSGMMGKLSKNGRAAANDIADAWKLAGERALNLFAEGDDAQPPTGGTKTYQGEGRDTKADPSRMPEFEAALAAQKLAWQQAQKEQGTFLEFGKQAEADYWREVSRRADLGANDRASAVKKAIDLELGLYREAGQQHLADLREELQGARNNAEQRLEIATRNAEEIRRLYGEDSQADRAAQRDKLEAARALAAQRLQLAQVEVEAKQLLAENEVAFERDMLEQSLAEGLISRSEYLVQLQRLEQQQYQIALAGLEARKALIDPTQDPVAFAQLAAQIEALQQAHVLRMAAINRQGTLPANRDFQAMMGNLEQSLSLIHI